MTYNIQTYAVIGAGNMGSGIAQKIATEGMPVVLVDLTDEQVERGMGIIKTMLDQGVERRIFRPEQAEAILARITPTSNWNDLANVDLVIEAVFENLDVKKKVFSRLGEVCKPNAILGTNTSSFFVKDVAAACSNPERVVGLHYFFHPAKNRLVEVIGHELVDEKAMSAAWAAQEAIGKTPIHSADAPGFVVNRYFVPWLNEAVRLLDEGVADVATIDWAAKKAFEIGMGPFELMNVTGVPIAMHAANTLGQELHAFYAPAPGLVHQVNEVKQDWVLSGTPDESKFDAIASRLLGVTFYIAAKLVDEGVASVEDTDIGARVGLRWIKGPFQLLNETGIGKAQEMVRASMAPHGLEVPPFLAQADEGGIPIRLVSVGKRGALTSIWIDRPDAMNALNPAVGAQFDAAVEHGKANGAGIVIGGSGKAFVAGADIKFFVDNLRADAFQDIYSFTKDGQMTLRKLSGGDKAVVARVQGLSLGGGSELALACDWIVASPKASFGFPETGIGIYPGLGGTQRLPRRVGLPLAKYLIFTGQSLSAKKALNIGLCDDVTDFASLDQACEKWAEKGSVQQRAVPTIAPSQDWELIWDFFSRWTVEQILSGDADSLGEPQLEKAVKLMGFKSANALKMAERLLNDGEGLELNAALDLELEHLETAFSHPDALEGLSSLIEGRRPAFVVGVSAI
ncbi:MAG: 3-hydroxyacyl-CoA dehydrogenase/enoyl-CoA hydratase family protein [Planctomycetes bacterium]|jgi:enoyl-CoA hydratase/3-hydroxyacyl-CoA dehydrogenase|nr:3-hydroxyacyl-CoA dehydrogenase/enoyl-CoA hydratase family protein [Planctomycetota bacterium]MBT4028962.1 3-hydroxyacyl-CoA dehydrogenase/enoyl-CoA hydratase family protein [Planctomycetota bacterium]MBT4560381.1 3-hydroxyacyl-CoA dehydrogenase/enoyl-CoA hydratase family protein [Planctomycetota bacterium]MBT5119451.1 3-hydroxyacyl-CoA dehydrogenase/enoyl-CoA hydratase family protein [Planctomycetota bacterium]MBT7012131.1 3-hydroxyacyl-CoA dehydrogenase/enoyl-CoA hydratase family protein [